MNVHPVVEAALAEHPYPFLFASISGAHLYGFPSPDSDYDLRGVHLLPHRELLGLEVGRETVEVSEVREGVEIDLVTHDAKKFFLMLLKPNGYVLEQLFSPLVLRERPELEELRAIAKGCVTRHHVHHYLGFTRTQWRLFESEAPRRVKPLLYVYRVLLTGIHLMRTGEVESNLLTLNQELRLPFIDELVARKREGPEKATLPEQDFALHEREKDRLVALLEQEAARTKLPDRAGGKDALNALLLRLRGVR